VYEKHTAPAAPGHRLGLDIGGTKTLAVLLDPAGSMLASRRDPTLRGSDGVVRAAVEAVGALLREAGLGAERAWSLGVGVPGLVEAGSGRVSHAANLGLDGGSLELGALLGEQLGRHVAVENDVNAAALGATTLLDRGAPHDVAYLNLGTGVAAGIVLDGELRRGARGAAGEIGHLALDPAGPRCACGQRGCLETIASGSALTAAWPSESAPPARALFDAADAGDAEAIRIRTRFAAAVATAVRILCLTTDVETVVIGGGVAQLGDRLRVVVTDALAAQAASSPFLASLELPARLRVVPADHPVAAVGAALLAGAEAVAA
jgi:predicted NBD/HSP70 family sugar kinase